MIDALNSCLATGACAPQLIDRIEVYGPKNLFVQHMDRRPLSVMGAPYSLPITVAVALLLDPRSPDSFNEAAIVRQDVLEIADKVHGLMDPDLEALYPSRLGVRVRLHFVDATVLENTVLDSSGSPGNPLDHAGYEKKFRALTDGVLTQYMQRELLSTIEVIEFQPTVTALCDLLSKPLARLGETPKQSADFEVKP